MMMLGGVVEAVQGYRHSMPGCYVTEEERRGREVICVIVV